MKKYSGKEDIIEAIKINGVPAGEKGRVVFVDNDGKLFVEWENGKVSVVQERGETYRLLEEKNNNNTRNLFWNIKKFFVNLLKN